MRKYHWKDVKFTDENRVDGATKWRRACFQRWLLEWEKWIVYGIDEIRGGW